MEKSVLRRFATSGMHKILQVRELTESTFVLRMERGGLQFKAGQHIVVGLEKDMDLREYSVYSGENDDYLEILIREVPAGKVSGLLKNSKKGDLLQVNGPFGSFGIEKHDMFTKKFVFVASGTGISPFHSFVRSYPGIDYLLIHGVRYSIEAYEKADYDPERYILCTSKEGTEDNSGRVTRLLPGHPLSPGMLFYLCGNNNMIIDARNILIGRGVPDEYIFSEIYF